MVATPCDAVNFWIGHFPLSGVFASGFAQMFARLGLVQNVVNHLKHKPHGFAPSREAIKRVGVGGGGERAHSASRADQRSSFLAVDQFQLLRGVEVRWKSTKRVEHLSGNHVGGGRCQFMRDVRRADLA